jgi:hypothetical protein
LQQYDEASLLMLCELHDHFVPSVNQMLDLILGQMRGRVRVGISCYNNTLPPKDEAAAHRLHTAVITPYDEEYAIP